MPPSIQEIAPGAAVLHRGDAFIVRSLDGNVVELEDHTGRFAHFAHVSSLALQLDLFSAPSASVGKVRAHHAVAAPVARAAAPAASLQSGATYRYGGLVTKPCGLWRGQHLQHRSLFALDAYASEVWA